MSLILRQSNLPNTGSDLIKGSPLTYDQLDGNFAAISASLALRPSVAGPGIVINGDTISSSLLTVNGVYPTNGNINVTLTNVITGPLNTRPLSAANATVYVVSQDPVTSNNGDAYIYVATTSTWEPIAPLDQVAADARYLKLDAANGPMQGTLDMGTWNLTNVGTMFGTATTASFVTGSGVYGPFGANSVVSASWAGFVTGSIFSSSNQVLSSSYAITASYALNATPTDTSKILSGSTVVQTYASGLVTISGSSIATTILAISGGLVVGYNTAAGTNAVAFGSASVAVANYSFAHGDNVIASQSYSHAEGQGTVAAAAWSHTEGLNTRTTQTYAHAEGAFTTASAQYSHTEGYSTTTAGFYSHAEGYDTVASGEASHVEGLYTTASGDYSHAEGSGSRALGKWSHTEGEGAIAYGTGSHAEGYIAVAYGDYSHAEGNGTVASGSHSHAEGDATNASGSYSHAEGLSTIASGIYSHAEGQSTIASGESSHAEGTGAVAYGTYSHAEGNTTIASGSYSHAEGFDTIAFGECSHAEGTGTQAYGFGSHAEGSSGIAYGFASHAEGNTTIASGSASHAEGISTIARGAYSHAEGSGSIAHGDNSHAEGIGTIASGSGQLAVGQYNLQGNTTSLFVIGNGASNVSRSDVMRVSGSSVQITGSLNVNSTLIVSGSSVQVTGSLNANNTLFVSGSSVGIGTTPSLTYRLDVSESARIQQDLIFNNGPTNQSYIYFGGSSAFGSYIRSNGYNLAFGARQATRGNAFIQGTTGHILATIGSFQEVGYPDSSNSVFQVFKGDAVLGTSALYIQSGSGNIGVGITTPTYPLHISATSSLGSLNVNNTLYVSSSRVAIGTTAPSYSLDVRGGGRFTSTLWLDNFTVGITNLSFIRPSDGAEVIAVSMPNSSTLRVGGGNINFTDVYTANNFTARFGDYAANNTHALTTAGGLFVSGASTTYTGIDYFFKVSGSGVSGSFKVDNTVITSGSHTILPQVSSSLNFANDTAAAAGGVPLGGLYRNGNTILIRLV